MKHKKLFVFGGILLLVAIVVGTVLHNRRHPVDVQSAMAKQGPIKAEVSAEGDIKPKHYADISANVMGEITAILVKEGDHVHRGQLLATIENVQQGADVAAQKAAISTARANYSGQVAALATARADLRSTQAKLRQAQQDWDREQQLFKDQLVSRADYDSKQAAYHSAVADEQLSAAKVSQAQSSVLSSKLQIAQAQANLRRTADVYAKTQLTSPLDGIVTYLPMQVGESVVPGIQNSQGSLIMTVADMSVVTAELKVDESDIVNVKLGQPVSISVDAYGKKKLSGTVTEVGDTAILRSTGQAASLAAGSTSEDAKDFKVVVLLSNPPASIRPGLSCTAKITTDTAQNALKIPIQAVVERLPSALNPPGKNSAEAASPTVESGQPEKPLQGVFVIRNGKAEFVEVKTGIMGLDHVQVLSGLKAGDRVVSGPYKALQTIRNHADVKVVAAPAVTGVPVS